MTKDKLTLEAQREQAKQRLREGLRSGQREMADWRGGPLAVSAVPGAGKSKGMADAAALTLAARNFAGFSSQRDLVMVTFTRSAAANIKAKIREALKQLLVPPRGFFVYTLHGLAFHIADQHPQISGISSEEVTVISPIKSNQLIKTCVEKWISTHPREYQILVEGTRFDGEETERLRRMSVLRTEVLPELVTIVIHEAKSSGLLPDDLRSLAAQVPPDEYQVMAIAAGLYTEYQNLLTAKQLIDYDDMIMAAERVLENPEARKIWRQKIFAVFEDEAQDSTPLQTKLLEILATDPENPDAPPNLIRVGDPNQAINSTFTPADPIYFRRFCEECQKEGRFARMDRAGRSSKIIIDAANFMLHWVNNHSGKISGDRDNSPLVHSETPFESQNIVPVSAGDPQKDANPAPTGLGLEIYTPRDIYHTVELIGRRIVELFGREKDRSAAVLVRENRQGKFIADILANPESYNIKVNLAQQGIEVYEVAAGDRRSEVPAELLAILQFLHRPHSPDYLKAALRVLIDRSLISSIDTNALAAAPEQFLYPSPLEPKQSETVNQARQFCINLLQGRLEVPLYQLISFLAFNLNYNAAELATADKVADRVSRQIYRQHSLTAVLELLEEIVNTEKFEPVDTEEDPHESVYTKKGRLTIITMHKAKGLDWDWVFLPFLHEKVIPGSLWVPPPRQFLGEYSLAEVARAQIRAHLHGKELPDPETAWKQAQDLKTAEEYRLLYVAMTRAKRLLWMSAARNAPFNWNKPESTQNQAPCPVIPPLKSHFLDD
ncbi:MAG: ATP-dependent helicase [Oscillatoriaceae cyanobacterium]